VSKYRVHLRRRPEEVGPAGLTLVIVRDDCSIGALPITHPRSLEGAGGRRFDGQYAADLRDLHLGSRIRGCSPRWHRCDRGKEHCQAALLYDYLDTTAFYRCPARKEDRSRMNVRFHSERSLDEASWKGAKAAGMDQLKGHRAVGGMRAIHLPTDGRWPECAH